jgi:hypothetical protein
MNNNSNAAAADTNNNAAETEGKVQFFVDGEPTPPEGVPVILSKIDAGRVLANNIHLMNTLQLFGFSCDILPPEEAVKDYDVQIQITKRFLPGQPLEYRLAYSHTKHVLKLYRVSGENPGRLLRVSYKGHRHVIDTIVRDTAEALFNLASAKTNAAG